jgi:hypothetical protein
MLVLLWNSLPSVSRLYAFLSRGFTWFELTGDTCLTLMTLHLGGALEITIQNRC